MTGEDGAAVAAVIASVVIQVLAWWRTNHTVKTVKALVVRTGLVQGSPEPGCDKNHPEGPPGP